MTRMVSLAQLKEKLATANSPTERNLFFAALLREAGQVAPGSFFVVGGSAMEIYTVGKYTSGDIDIVCDQRQRLKKVLYHWEFAKPTRVFESGELGLVVDLVKPPYTGSVERTTLATTPFGPVRLAAIEDLLVKRLSSATNWSRRSDLEHAKMLALQFADSLDWDYIEQYATVHGVLELAKELRALVHQRNAP